MSEPKAALHPCPFFINGEWNNRTGLPTSPVHNPSTGEVIAESQLADATTVNDAVSAAKEAFPAWWDASVERARVMFKYRALIDQEFDSICQTISLEHGKTLAESRGELQRGLECVEYACGIPELLKGEYLENIAWESTAKSSVSRLVLRRNYSVQFPRHDRHVDVPISHFVGEYLHLQAQRKSAANRDKTRAAS